MATYRYNVVGDPASLEVLQAAISLTVVKVYPSNDEDVADWDVEIDDKDHEVFIDWCGDKDKDIEFMLIVVR